MTEHDMERWKRAQQDAPSESELKADVDLDLIFRGTLSRLIAKKFGVDVSLIWSYKPAELDDPTRGHLKTLVKGAMASPRDTGIYQLVMQTRVHPDEARAIKSVEIEGLLVLGLLGEIEVIPALCALMREHAQDARLRITAGAVLRFLTGQDIGGYVLSDDDLSLWEKWWERNRPRADPDQPRVR